MEINNLSLTFFQCSKISVQKYLPKNSYQKNCQKNICRKYPKISVKTYSLTWAKANLARSKTHVVSRKPTVSRRDVHARKYRSNLEDKIGTVKIPVSSLVTEHNQLPSLPPLSFFFGFFLLSNSVSAKALPLTTSARHEPLLRPSSPLSWTPRSGSIAGRRSKGGDGGLVCAYPFCVCFAPVDWVLHSSLSFAPFDWGFARVLR